MQDIPGFVFRRADFEFDNMMARTQRHSGVIVCLALFFTFCLFFTFRSGPGAASESRPAGESAPSNGANKQPELGEAPGADLPRLLGKPLDYALNCPPYKNSSLYTERQFSMVIGPEKDWVREIEEAKPSTEILLRDGTYNLARHAVLVADKLTIRSLSGDRSSVSIVGRGYSVPGEGLMLLGNDITIADLTITAMRDHAISIKPLEGARRGSRIYNVHLVDIGTQHVKLNTGGSANGLVACSSVGYGEGGVIGDYNGAIDLHQAKDWIVRDNYLYGIRGDGTGCNVKRDCGKYTSGPAVLAWRQSSGTRVTRNVIFDSYRNIAFGLGSSHEGGVISYNLIVQARPGDAGIELQNASGALVEYNTVVLSGAYPGAIEYRDSRNLHIHTNYLTSAPLDRGGNSSITVQRNNVDPLLAGKIGIKEIWDLQSDE
ncbi:hypothetical protein AB833_26205 [Chromatiales bacterium (ex Bugula neritina AB1)]|nr:hypothetical protein AB833_26205 [Chromatiales bacterium (ex Bugula neritina AB1)]